MKQRTDSGAKSNPRTCKKGHEAYKAFLKAKGGLDFLSSDEKSLMMSPGFDFKTLSTLQLPPKGKGIEAFLELQKLSSKSLSESESNIYFSPSMEETCTISQLLIEMITSAIDSKQNNPFSWQCIASLMLTSFKKCIQRLY